MSIKSPPQHHDVFPVFCLGSIGLFRCMDLSLNQAGFEGNRPGNQLPRSVASVHRQRKLAAALFAPLDTCWLILGDRY